ncbi:MAG: GTP-binding protein [Candidatus Levybacteria bacterium]|nr:GTP-binding protein [Candidatus Levybacteria bacterium]
MRKDNKKIISSKSTPIKLTPEFPPVLAVLGHVDHGKTTLLDAIRKTNVAQRESGGITQKIGASKIEFIEGGNKKYITFIDTPGHEAFSKMRGRGAQVADIGLLIISSVDGVKPQTKESIEILKEAQVPFIVVLTKSDLPEKNPEKVKQQLLKEDIKVEGYGGDIPVIEVSAKTDANIKELLGLISLVFEMREKPQISDNLLRGVIIESKQDSKSGPLATVVIKNGILNVRDEIVCADINGRVRSLINDQGERLNSASIGDAVEVLGFDKAPQVGSLVIKKGQAEVASKNFPARNAGKVSSVNQGASGANTREENFASSPLNFFEKEEPILSIVLCADTLGSLEAIINALPPEINVAKQKTGDITPADIIFAKSIKALVLGFNIKIKPDILKLAKTEKILAKNYSLIYELIDELKDVLEGKQISAQEEIFGTAKILASFPFEKTKALGVKVVDGRIARGDKTRLIRGEDIIGESTITSVRQGKTQVSKAEKGSEAGVILSPLLDFTIGDMLVSHE